MPTDTPMDVIGLLDAAAVLRKIDEAGGLGMFEGATTKPLKIIEGTGRLNEEARRMYVIEMSDIFFKGVQRTMQKRQGQLLFEDTEDVEVIVAPGSLDEETKEDIKQLLADIKGRARREGGAAAGSSLVAVQRQGAGRASAGMGAAGTSGRTYCSKYIKGECSSSAACGPTPGHGGGPSASARGGKEGREEEGRKDEKEGMK